MNNSEKEQLVNEIATKINQLAGLAVGLVAIGYDVQQPEKYGVLYRSEVGHIEAFIALVQLVEQSRSEAKDLTEKLIDEL